MPSAILAALVATNLFAKSEGPVGITANRTFYDRKEGMVVFQGDVHVLEQNCQMHADRAYVFLNETNDLKRIAAIGNVALTNGFRRAYGDKVTYQRSNGLVVLHGAEGKPAEVIEDEAKGPRSVKGRKIRFWTNEEQIEVLEMDASAPMDAYRF